MVPLVLLLCFLSCSAADDAFEKGWDKFWQDDLRDMSEPISLKLEQGSDLPAWLRGSLIRNGPAQFTSPKRNVTFAYDGLAKLYKFEVRDGAVKYQERFLRTACFNLTRETQSFPKGPMMGPAEPPFNPLQPPGKGTDNVNTQAWYLAGDKVGLATTDSAVIGMFDPETLDTVGMLNYPHHAPGDAILLSATHPHVLPGSDGGMLVNVVSQLLGVGNHQLTVYKMGADHVQIPFGTVSVPFMPYIHSFGVTEEHMLLAIYPLSFKELCVLEFKPLIDCLDWLDKNVSIFVFPFNGSKDSKPLLSVEAPSHFSMHHVNSFQDKDYFYLDVAAYGDGGVFKSKFIHGSLEVMQNPSERNHVPHWAMYRRVRVERSTGAVDMVDMKLEDSDGMVYKFDFPFINPAYDARKHCVMWAVSAYAGNSTDYADWGLVRVDTCTESKVNTVAWRQPGQVPSEAVFVARPGAAAEDDGVLLVQVLDAAHDDATSFLLILDARSMKELARAYLPSGWVTPYSQHGTWFPSSELSFVI